MLAAALIAATLVLVALILRQLGRGIRAAELHEGDAIEHSRPRGNVRRIERGE